jgi:predicted Fe-Mo cluster-binding NifX family protein
MNKKVAIPIRDEQVDHHIVQCDYFTIFSISCGIIVNKENLFVPENCKNIANIALFLTQKNVEVMLIGNIWNDEIEILTFHGIEVFYNCIGNVNDLIRAYLNGELSIYELKNKGFCRISKN